MATIPTLSQLDRYQQAITGIKMRCPNLDVVVGVTQILQALHDQAERDVSALDVLKGVLQLLGDNSDEVECSNAFSRYLRGQTGV